MPVLVTCPHCQSLGQVPDVVPGQRLLCAGCRLAFTPIPSSAASAPPMVKGSPPPSPNPPAPVRLAAPATGAGVRAVWLAALLWIVFAYLVTFLRHFSPQYGTPLEPAWLLFHAVFPCAVALAVERVCGP